MKTIGFIGAYDKTDLIVYIARILVAAGKKVLVIDATTLQKAKYIVPAISPTKSYVTNFEDIDIAVGLYDFTSIKEYLGMPLHAVFDYDYIFIDCAPVGMVIDAAIVAKCSDAAIMMIESGAVKRKLALEAKEKLETAGCPILGVVLNKVERKSGGYYRKYYKKYEEAAKVEG